MPVERDQLFTCPMSKDEMRCLKILADDIGASMSYLVRRWLWQAWQDRETAQAEQVKQLDTETA